MILNTVTTSVNDLLKEITKQAEAEVERRLVEVATKAIETNKQKIISDVSDKYKTDCVAMLIHSTDSASFQFQFSLKFKSNKS